MKSVAQLNALVNDVILAEDFDVLVNYGFLIPKTQVLSLFTVFHIFSRLS
jgi:hypothetical protein